MLYTGPVGRCGRLAPIGFAALLVCLPGALQARGTNGPDYTIYLSSSAPLAKVELSVMPASAEWDVTADYNAARCEIHCSWRRKRDALGSMPLLPPPIALVRIYSNFVARPAIVTLDPAGLGLPGATRDVPLRQDAMFLAARRLFAAPPAQSDDCGASNRPRPHFLSSSKQPEVISASALPLRI